MIQSSGVWSSMITKGTLLQIIDHHTLSLNKNVKRALFNINTGDCQIINKVQKKQENFIWRELSTEINNHAETHCFGVNFLPISFSLEECAFLHSYQNI